MISKQRKHYLLQNFHYFRVSMTYIMIIFELYSNLIPRWKNCLLISTKVFYWTTLYICLCRNHLHVIQWFVSCFKGSWFFRLKIHNEISPEPSSTLHKYHFYTQKYYHEYETLPFKTKNRKVLYLKFQYKNKYNLGLQIDPFVILYRIWLMV